MPGVKTRVSPSPASTAIVPARTIANCLCSAGCQSEDVPSPSPHIAHAVRVLEGCRPPGHGWGAPGAGLPWERGIGKVGHTGVVCVEVGVRKTVRHRLLLNHERGWYAAIRRCARPAIIAYGGQPRRSVRQARSSRWA